MANSVELKPLDVNFTLKDHIYGVLREAIVNMDIYAEEADLKLDERQMAEQLGISRTPLREALARLEQEGFIEILPRRGVFIKRKSLEEILEMITVWAALESMAARLACEEASDAEIRGLRRITAPFNQDDAKAHLSEYSEANIDFHLYVLSLGKCRMIEDIAQGLFTHLKAVRRRAMRDSSRADRSIADHMDIIKAIEARDATLAAELVREHTMRLRDYIGRNWTFLTGDKGTPPAQRENIVMQGR